MWSSVFTAAAALASATPAVAPPRDATAAVSEVVVTAPLRRDLLGRAASASEGAITREALALRPIYRPGQLLEAVPGLAVTVHSGEGKASQYLLRGFNLDHGTDFASFVDDMPVNRPTNAHGQGYSDQNFLIPQLAAGLDYTKGPYYAAVGDFGAVGSAHVRLLDATPATLSLSAGTLGDQEAYLAGSHALAGGLLLAAAQYAHLDGPWAHPDNFHKLNLALRWSRGTDKAGESLTALYDRGNGALTTDQPQRAVAQGLIGRFGTLDPSDGSRSERLSLSGRFARSGEGWAFTASAYAIGSHMTLWNDFTHFLADPVNGDQEAQVEARATAGGQAAYSRTLQAGPVGLTMDAGVQVRRDAVDVERLHTRARVPLATCEVADAGGGFTAVPAPGGLCTADRVGLLDVGPYLQLTARWTPWLRTVAGLREEVYQASDHSLTTGFRGATDQTLLQPKGSLVVGPFRRTEFYFSAGRGFHSDDVRGVFGTAPQDGAPASAGRTPLLVRSDGAEVGLRTSLIPRVQLQAALFQQDFASELAYDPDIGQDSASAPSRRRGVDVSAQYRPWRWLELNGDVTVTRARYHGDLAAFGLGGPYIANAPASTVALGALVDRLGPWSGGVQVRNLGPYPISDGDRRPSDRGYTEVNLDVAYRLNRATKLQLAVFNLFDSRANASAYFYTARLPAEPAAGVAGYQLHPLEPLSARFGVTATF